MGPAGSTRAPANGGDAEPGVAESDDEATSGPPTAVPQGVAESPSAAGACPSASMKFPIGSALQNKTNPHDDIS